MSRPGRRAPAGIAIAVLVMITVAVVGWSSAVARDSPPRELLRMHDDFVLAFIETEGFGKMRITPMMRVMQRYRTQDEPPLWVEDLQLIGIAKHTVPVAFSSPFQGFRHLEEDLPGVSRRDGRLLTQEEQDAVAALQAGERLVVRKEEAGLRVTGPIRAGSECLGCHKKERAGDLLGALVYRLRPLPSESSSTH
jgi:hypothetical protein